MIRPFLLDGDTGRDDALAIWLCQALKLPLQAVISTHGNTALGNVVENNRRVLYAGSKEYGLPLPPLYTGANAPEKSHTAYETTVIERQKKSGNGLCNLELPPAPADYNALPLEQIDNTAGMTNDESREYVVTGPATSLARLLRTGGKTARSIRRITMMGGKFENLRRTVPGADFNLLCDPFALKYILEENENLEIRLVPMDSTWPLAMSVEEIEELSPKNALAETAKELMIAHCRHFAPEPVFRFHDPAVIMALSYPDSFKEENLTIETEEQNPSFGLLMTEKSGRSVKIFKPDADRRAIIKDRILQTLGF